MAANHESYRVRRTKFITIWDCGNPCNFTHYSEQAAQKCLDLRRIPREHAERDRAIIRAVLGGRGRVQVAEEFSITRQGVYVMLKRQFARIGEQNMKGIPCSTAKDMSANGAALLKLLERWWRMDDPKR